MGTQGLSLGQMIPLELFTMWKSKGTISHMKRVLISENQKASSVWSDTFSLSHRVHTCRSPEEKVDL